MLSRVCRKKRRFSHTIPATKIRTITRVLVRTSGMGCFSCAATLDGDCTLNPLREGRGISMQSWRDLAIVHSARKKLHLIGHIAGYDGLERVSPFHASLGPQSLEALCLDALFWDWFKFLGRVELNESSSKTLA